MCTQAQLQTIQNTIYKFASDLFGTALDCVIMYGSYARGDFDEESDVDIMVRVRMDKMKLIRYRRRFSDLGSELGLEHNVVVSIHVQDAATFNRYKDVQAFYRNVDREGVVVNA